MNAPRVIWRRAHPVRIKDRVNTAPHAELLEARIHDLCTKELEAALADMPELVREGV